MWLTKVLVGCALLHAAVAQGQEQVSKPTTKLESFQGKTGTVVIRGYSTVGRIQATNGTVSIDARDIRDASTQSARVTGISIEVKEQSRLAREDRSFIDVDEIESLLQGIDYIANATSSVTSLERFEAEYRTKGDFAVTVFSGSDGQISLAVSSGRIGRVSAFLNLSQLPELRSLIVAARSKL